MAMTLCKATVADLSYLTHNVVQLRCRLQEPNSLDFEAGQFMMLDVPNDENKIIKRAYSIASSPSQKGLIDFVIKILPEGKASSYVPTLKEGDEVSLSGPLGHFTLQQDHSKDMLFVATGTGIAPIKSMIYTNLEHNNTHHMHLFFGVREEKDVYLKGEFEALAEKYENFHFSLTLSRPSDEWEGLKGRVTDHARQLELNSESTQAYLCGAMEMVNEVKEILTEKGLAKEEVRFEIY